MEAIKLYLDSVFAAVPNTAEVQRLKTEMLANMEEKYSELKASGVSENEAIGSVISDFGNVEELFAEMGNVPAGRTVNVESESTTTDSAVIYPLLTRAQIDTFLDTYKRSARGISLGIFLIFVGVVQIILAGTFFSAESTLVQEGSNITVTIPDAASIGTLSVALFFLFLIPAVALIIHHGMNLSNFDDIDEGRFRLDAGQRALLKVPANDLQGRDSRRVVTGVTMILVGVVAVVLSGSAQMIFDNATPQAYIGTLALSLFLLAAGIAVRIFIVHFMERSAYDKLLQRGEYTPEKRKSSRLVDMIASIYWPLTVALYLAWSFITGDWHITWVIWPFAGILFGGIAAFLPEFIEERTRKQ